MTAPNRRWFIISLLIVLAQLAQLARWARTDEKQSEERLPLSVKTSIDRGKLAMGVELVVTPAKPVSIYENSLPWKSRYSMVIIAATLHGEPLETLLTIDDPVPGTIEIRDRLQLSGTVDLKGRFPGLAEQLKKADVLIFWSYQLSPIEGARSDRLGGWFVIQKEAVRRPARPAPP